MSESTGMAELLSTVVSPADLRIIEWTITESICGPFRVELVATCASNATKDLADRLLGQNAIFLQHSESRVPQARRGVIVEAHVEGDYRETGKLRLALVPRLGLAAMRIHSRIFQDKTIPQILETLVGEWQMDHEMQLGRSYATRTYTTQYEESDLAFVLRLCAKEGMGFYLAHRNLTDEERTTPGKEKVVFYDASTYPSIANAEADATGSLAFRRDNFEPQEHEVTKFDVRRSVRPELARLGDFDFRNPRLPLRATAALAKDLRSPIGEELGDRLSIYHHADRDVLGADPKVPAEVSDAIAQIRLAQARDSAEVGFGNSRCTRLAPGRRFKLELHPLHALNKEYVITRMTHRGSIPEGDQTEGTGGPVYENDFECAPVEVVASPPYQAAPLRQTLESAVVVGPTGEEVHCDENGRVKVQFHWDLEGKSDETSSCYLRVSQPWSGTNWGAQFIPRVGSEVLVGFLGGDVDRPIVMSSVYNGVRPWPFRLPAEALKAGFRSHSSPGGDGFSELTFDDTKGREAVSLRAERDFAQVVQNNYSLSIEKSESVDVGGASNRTYGAEATMNVKGERTDTIAKDYKLSVDGTYDVAVTGNSDVRVTGNRMTRIEGREQAELAKDVNTTYKGDQVARVLGHAVTVVGQDDARRSSTLHVEGSAHQFSTGSAEIVSDKEIVLRCGGSSVRLGPESIQLVSKQVSVIAETVETQAEDKIVTFAEKQIAFVAENVDTVASKVVRLKGETGQVQLDQNARIDGTLVKLNCQPDPVEEAEAEPYEPPKKTTIKLADEDGKPLAGKRFKIVDKSGQERGGVLNEKGEATMYLEEGGEIVFLDVDKPRLK